MPEKVNNNLSMQYISQIFFMFDFVLCVLSAVIFRHDFHPYGRIRY